MALEIIRDWNDVLKNLREFKKIVNGSKCYTLDNFSMFYHWYYFPNQELFAPGKFLGYRKTTISSYTGKGWGGVTQEALQEYFNKVPRNSSEFNDLYSE